MVIRCLTSNICDKLGKIVSINGADKLDTHMQNKEISSISLNLHKNQSIVDQMP